MEQNKTILVVDDDAALRTGLLTLFQKDGYRTLEADDGLEAMEVIKEQRPDLVILDMMLPRWGGLAVLEHFQDHPASPQFIMLSGHDGQKHKAYARQLGVVDYLHKPCSMQRLLQRIGRFFQAQAPADSSPRVSRSSLTTWKFGERTVRILLVPEPHPLNAVIANRLEQFGCVIDIAHDGGEADSKVRHSAYDVIVLGLQLPTIDGATLLRNWRKDGISTDILVLSARDATHDKVNGFNLGADAYLTVPCRMEELLARLRTLLRRRFPVQDKVLQIYDLEIDTGTRTVKRSGQAIHLTPREFALLQLLACHRGQVVSRTMIWEHLYDEHSDFSSNVIDVYIRYLRTKIDRGFEPPLILTRRGEGYMLRGEER